MTDLCKQFLQKRFGMFIHWGVYAMLGGRYKGRHVGNELGEWIMNVLQIPICEYEKVAAAFNPVDFDAEKLVALAQRAGMQYMVITTKHHDGFALFRSRVDPYNSYDFSVGKRDLIDELSCACQKMSMPLGFYYSQALDWHEEHAGGWDVKPSKSRISWANAWDFPDHESKNFDIYFEKKAKPQVKELLTQYGDVFLFWFDTPRNMTDAQSEELYQLVKNRQPNCLVNSRIGNGRGDYQSLGDNQIPVPVLQHAYEAPVTLNDTWGYKHDDQNWKSGDEIFDMLSKLSSKNVNLLLNIGPTGTGALPEPTLFALHHLEQRRHIIEQAIVGTSPTPIGHSFDEGYVTMRDQTLYILCKENKDQTLRLNGINGETNTAKQLNDEQPILCTREELKGHSTKTLVLHAKKTNGSPPAMELTYSKPPIFDPVPMPQNHTVLLDLMSAMLFDGKSKRGRDVKTINRYLSYAHFGEMHLDIAGILLGWSKKEQSVTWDPVYIPDGSWRVQLITTDEITDPHLRADTRIRIECLPGKTPIFTDLRADQHYVESKTSKGNTRVITECGRLHIDQSGIFRIRLSLEVDAPRPIPLVMLKLKAD